MGRPKKYLDEESRKAAKRASSQRSEQRARDRVRNQNPPLQVILYHPIPEEVPLATPTAIGLRTNLNVPVSQTSISSEDAQVGIILFEGQSSESAPLPLPLPVDLFFEEDEDEVLSHASKLQDLDNIDQEREDLILTQVIQDTQAQELDQRRLSGLEAVIVPDATAITITESDKGKGMKVQDKLDAECRNITTTTATPIAIKTSDKGKGKAQYQDNTDHEPYSLSDNILQEDIYSHFQEDIVNPETSSSLSRFSETYLDYSQIYSGDDPLVIADIQAELRAVNANATPTPRQPLALSIISMDPAGSSLHRVGTPKLLPVSQLPSQSSSSGSGGGSGKKPKQAQSSSSRKRHCPKTTTPQAGQSSLISWLNTQRLSGSSSLTQGSSLLSDQVRRNYKINNILIPSRRLPSHSNSGISSGSGNFNPLSSILTETRVSPSEFQVEEPGGSGTQHHNPMTLKWGPYKIEGEESPPFSIYLARHLWQFQGCKTHTQITLKSNCHRLLEITSLLQGQYQGALESMKVPKILDQSKQLLKRGDYDLTHLDKRAMFEGYPTATANVNPSGSESPMPATTTPWSLSLDHFHARSAGGKQPVTSFDIDSVCCFPTSLAVAKQGLLLIPQQYEPLSLKGNVHLGLQVKLRGKQDQIKQVWQPLHQIRHFCIGQLIGMPLFLLCFFPNYDFERAQTSDSGSGGGNGGSRTSTLLRREDEIMFIDQILLPTLFQVIQDPNILQYLPKSAAAIKVNSRASSFEQYLKIQGSREQIITYHLQPDILDLIWEKMKARIASATRYSCFSDATLFLNGKNLKINHMNSSLPYMITSFRNQWNSVIDSGFLNRGLTFFDLGKQVTSENTRLCSLAPAVAEAVASDSEAETYLYRKCCLDSVFSHWSHLDSSGINIEDNREDLYSAEDNPEMDTAATATATTPNSPSGTRTISKTRGFSRVYYPWATLRDTGSQTLRANRTSFAFKQGYIYGQFYNLIKQPFDSTKIYCFNNNNLENIALDPAYIQTLQKEGGAVSFSTATATASYLHSKKRASINIRDSRRTSFGVREEHRISLELLDEIVTVWQSWEEKTWTRQDLPRPLPPALPVLSYYVIDTSEVLDFVYAQINKYCLLFEYILSQTNKTHSLPEFIIMVLALRALRFSYSSSNISRERLLYRDTWQVLRNNLSVPMSGIGMAVAMAKYGIGWFMPKINWTTWRIRPPHGDQFLAGNMLIHNQYQKRWRAVRDLRDVYIRVGQAEQWFKQYDLSGSGKGYDKARNAWQNFFHGIVLNQFDADILATLQQHHKKRPELQNHADGSGSGIAQRQFCYSSMRRSFLGEKERGNPPHVITGNRARFTQTRDLIDFLFDSNDQISRGAWSKLPFRFIFTRVQVIIRQYLGEQWQRQWTEKFKYLVMITHWILPYANPTSFLNLTKTNKGQDQVGVTSWFSSVYREPPLIARNIPDWPTDRARHLGSILRFGARLPLPPPLPLPSMSRDQGWDIDDLLAVCSRVHLDLDKFSIRGQRQEGVSLLPEWEQGQPLRLRICEEIYNCSLDELEIIFAEKLRECGVLGDHGTGTGGSGSGMGNGGESENASEKE